MARLWHIWMQPVLPWLIQPFLFATAIFNLFKFTEKKWRNWWHTVMPPVSPWLIRIRVIQPFLFTTAIFNLFKFTKKNMARLVA